MKNKFSQYTSFDKFIENYHRPSYYYQEKQQILPYSDNEERYQIQKSHEQIKQKQEEKRQEEFTKQLQKQFPFKFPELTPEQIRYRPLTHQELDELHKEDERIRFEREKYYYGSSEDKNKPLNYKIFQINQELPEEIKKKVLNKYNELKVISTEFYKQYKEANEMAENEVSINYEDTYLNIVKNFPEFVINTIKKEIGRLFGIIPSGKKYRGEEISIRQLMEFIDHGINIFNITPLNYNSKMYEMSSVIHKMNQIMENYAKRKKLLIKLPELVREATKGFLSDKKNRDFLKWADEYFSNDKQDFIDSAIKDMFGGYSSYARKGFNIDDLKKIRTYKSVYESAIHSAKAPFSIIKNKALEELKRRLYEEIKNKLKTKLLVLSDIIERAFKDGSIEILELKQYLYKNFKFDLSSILNFVSTIIEKSNSNEEKNNEIDNKKSKKYILTFISEFKKELYELTTRSHQIGDLVNDAVQKFLTDLSDNNQINIKSFEKLTEKDLDNIVSDIIKKIIIDALPNFKKGYYGNYGYEDFPKFGEFGQIIKQTGKLSIDSITNYMHNAMPFIPKDFVLNLVRTLFKGIGPGKTDDIIKSFSIISQPNNSSHQAAMKLFLKFLEKHGKLNPNTFTNLFITQFSNFGSLSFKIRRDLKSVGGRSRNYLIDKDIEDILFTGIRSPATMDQDIKNIDQFVDFAHNNAADLNKEDLMIILRNKNFISFSKVGIVRKLVKIYAKIRDMGGVKQIYKDYGKSIRQLIRHNYINKDFYDNVLFILSLFRSGELISPKSEMFDKIFKITSSLETDIEIIETSEAFVDLLKGYKPKKKELFNLNININDQLRFRVLKDRDPRTLRVGVETNCCQRIGGAAESAAKDSFINPLAGVVILEWKDTTGEWLLLSQSYFHYVPSKNLKKENVENEASEEGESSEQEAINPLENGGYILDNVEKNQANVVKSGVNLDMMYAYLAQIIKQKFDISFFLAGKGYSKINESNFNTFTGMESDPRSFSDEAKGQHSSRVYTDFRSNNSINLLAPNPDISQDVEKMFGQKYEEVKQAFERNIRRIIFGSAAILAY